MGLKDENPVNVIKDKKSVKKLNGEGDRSQSVPKGSRIAFP